MLKISLIILIVLLFISCDKSFDVSSPFSYGGNIKIKNKCMKDSDCNSNELCKITNNIGICEKNPCIALNCIGECKVKLDSSGEFQANCFCSNNNDCSNNQYCSGFNICKLNPCTDNICGKHGNCIPDENGFHCKCDTGYFDDNNDCTTPCFNNPCGAGKCIAETVNNYHCECFDNYFDNEAKDNNEERTCITPCNQETCGIYGKCIADSIDNFHCECFDNYFDNEADNEKRSCINPCDNCNKNGTQECKSFDYNRYECICNSGYEGENCDIDIDECALEIDNCDDDKVCVNTIGGYSCDNGCNENNGKYNIGTENEEIICSNIYFVTEWETRTPNEVIDLSSVINIKDNGEEYGIECDYSRNAIVWKNKNPESGEFIKSCSYSKIGKHIIVLKGINGINFENNIQLITVKNWGNIIWKNMKNAFKGTVNLFHIDAVDTPNLSEVTDLTGMFQNSNIEECANLNNWNVSNIKNMSYMFDNIYRFNLDISSWDTSNVTNMSYMFNNAKNFNQDIGNWNTSSVTDMSYMFNNAEEFNANISSWDTSNVTDMSYMFHNAKNFNQPLKTNDCNDEDDSTTCWNVSKVKDMSYMFHSATFFDQDLSSWNVSNVSSCYEFFHVYANWSSPKPEFPRKCANIKYNNFAATSFYYYETDDWDAAVENDIGSDYRVADWNDLVAYYNNGGDILDLWNKLDSPGYGSTFAVTLNGKKKTSPSSNRWYYVERHEHNKPSNFSAHANIDNYLISLGSWSGARRILAIKR